MPDLIKNNSRINYLKIRKYKGTLLRIGSVPFAYTSSGKGVRALGCGILTVSNGKMQERWLQHYMMPKKDAYTTILICICYPVVVLVFQLSPLWATGAIAILFLCVSVFSATCRPFFLLSAFTGIGHGVWVLTASFVAAHVTDDPIRTIAGRFGLVGYILLFFLWQKISATKHLFWHTGDYKSSMKMPFVWFGYKETIGRFLLIFSSLFILAASFMFVFVGTTNLILPGLLFTIVNAVLEETLWRGFILARLADAVGEVAAVLSTSIAFGLYHISLGFSIWACLVFAVGGFFFAGAAARSKGLSAPILLHAVVSIFFVSIGLIF